MLKKKKKILPLLWSLLLSGWLIICTFTKVRTLHIISLQFYTSVNSSVVILWLTFSINWCLMVFPGGSDGKASACNVGDQGSIPGSERSPGEGNGNAFQYSCLNYILIKIHFKILYIRSLANAYIFWIIIKWKPIWLQVSKETDALFHQSRSSP